MPDDESKLSRCKEILKMRDALIASLSSPCFLFSPIVIHAGHISLTGFLSVDRKFEFWAENGECATSPILKPRIGSCEIVLSWQHRSSPRSIIIHSKLQSRKWPVAELIAEELRACLPMQYHDIRFLAQSSSQNSFPKGARFIVTVNEGSDPLGLIGKKTTAVADADGVAHISLPVGWYQIRVEHENFFPATFDYKIGTPISDEYQPFRRVVLHPRCEKDEIKVSLIWNESPADLDLYAVTPYTKISHQRRHDKESDVTFGDDARKGFGPEIITFKRAGKEQHTKHLRQGRSSSIHIYVHNYSEECELNESGAIVTIMGETGILHQIEVPKVGIGDFWDVCSIEMRHLHVADRNKLVPSEPDFDIIKSESENGEDRYALNTPLYSDSTAKEHTTIVSSSCENQLTRDSCFAIRFQCRHQIDLEGDGGSDRCDQAGCGAEPRGQERDVSVRCAAARLSQLQRHPLRLAWDSEIKESPSIFLPARLLLLSWGQTSQKK